MQDHEARITGLVLLKKNMLASVSFDRSIRIWDLASMKPVAVVPNAHETPIQCVEYSKAGDGELEDLAEMVIRFKWAEKIL